MKWINCKDKPPTKGAVVRVIADKEVLVCNAPISNHIWDIKNDLDKLEWLDETPSLDSEIKLSDKDKFVGVLDEIGITHSVIENDGNTYAEFKNVFGDQLNIQFRPDGTFKEVW